MPIKFSFPTGLGFKAAVSVAAPILVILIIASAISGVITYRSANTQLENNVQNTVADDVDLITEYLWQLDYRSVQSKLDAYVKFGQITGAKVVDDNGLLLQAGALGQDVSAYIKTYSFNYQQKNGPVNIGTLTLEASRDQSWAQAQRQFIRLITVALITVLLTIYLINRLLGRVVVSPIKQIAHDLQQRPADWREFKILQGNVHSDELDELVVSIHNMRDQILASQSEAAYGQKRLATAAELAGLGYATSDLVLDRFLECDEIYAAMYGKSADEMLGLSIRKNIIEELIHPDERVRGREVVQQMLDGESITVTDRIRMDSGEYRHIKKIFTAKAIPEGRAGVVDIVAQDMTEINEMREHLFQTQKMDAIGKLTGGVAHDFNNILAVISGNVELMQLSATDHTNEEFFQAVLKAVNRGAELTNRLLAFARKQPLSPTVLNIGSVLRGSEQLLRVSAGEAISLEIVVDGGLWYSEVDRTQLEAVILNIVVNAKDAMPSGGFLNIDAGNTRLDRTYADSHDEVLPGQYVCISITDSGSGMDAETLEKAIDPFYTTKEVGKGTGLGLSMAFGFAKQSGGHLKIYSELGHGTTVKIYLPRSFSEAKDVAENRTAKSNADFRGLHLLLVEDNNDLKKTYEAQLRQIGFTVHSATDGPSALEIAKSIANVDVILSDVILPKQMNGNEVVKQLSLIFPDAIAIFMSGFSENSIIHQGRLDEGVTLLQKPFTLADLVAVLTRALKRSQ